MLIFNYFNAIEHIYLIHLRRRLLYFHPISYNIYEIYKYSKNNLEVESKVRTLPLKL